jgi:hypothetical protein
MDSFVTLEEAHRLAEEARLEREIRELRLALASAKTPAYRRLLESRLRERLAASEPLSARAG